MLWFFEESLRIELMPSPKNIEVLNGSVNEWLNREDGALIGANLAQRRRLDVGDSFDAAGVTVVVSGIIRSAESSQDDNVAYVHLPFLQQASRVGLGTVTQFLVKVSDSSLLIQFRDKSIIGSKQNQNPPTQLQKKLFLPVLPKS